MSGTIRGVSRWSSPPATAKSTGSPTRWKRKPCASKGARTSRSAGTTLEVVRLSEIESVSLSGKDAASGRTWESWIRRYAEKKLAGEAASIESEPLG